MPLSLLRRILPGLLIVVILLIVGLYHRTPKPIPDNYSATDFIMGTYVRVILVTGEETGREVSGKIFSEFRRIEGVMSSHLSSSLIHRLNAGELAPADDPELGRVVANALKIGRESGWAFNPAVGPLVSLWNVESAHPRVPPADSIKIAVSLSDPERVLIDGSRLAFSGPGTALDLGGIAKGYAIDRGLEIIRDFRIKNGLIDAGGDIGALGHRPAGGPWRIGIQHPREQEVIIGVLRLGDRTVATSGDYQRYFMEGGRRYHHIIDPHTGFPGHRAVSVTVVGPKAETADALATAAFVLGMKDGLELLETRPGVEGVIIAQDVDRADDGLVYGMTSGLKGELEIDLNPKGH